MEVLQRSAVWIRSVKKHSNSNLTPHREATGKIKELEKSQGALLATNFYNYETVTGVLRAAEELRVPIILQSSPSTINYMGVGVTAALGRAALEKHNVEEIGRASCREREYVAVGAGGVGESGKNTGR